MSNSIKILHLRYFDVKVQIATFIKKNISGASYRDVDSLESFFRVLKNFDPDVILADNSTSFCYYQELVSGLWSRNIKVPVILIIDAESEASSAELLENGVEDYVFYDRLSRLPSVIKRTVKDIKGKHENRSDKPEFGRDISKLESFFLYNYGLRLVLTPEADYSYISPSLKSLLGYLEEEIPSDNFYKMILPEDRIKIEEGVMASLELPATPVELGVVRIMDKNENLFWLEITFVNFLQDMDINGLVVEMKDVTQYKEIERVLREKEEKYRAFVDSSLDGILMTKPDGTVLSANPAACRMYGMSEEELCLAGRAGTANTADPRLALALEEREKTGKFQGELSLLKRDGTKFPVEISSVVYYTSDGEERTAMIIRDITERKKMEAELKVSKNNYKYLFRNSPLPNVIYDVTNYEILDVNEAAKEFYQYSRDEFLERTILDFLPEEEILRVRDFLNTTQHQEGKMVQHQMFHVKKDQNHIPVETYGYPVRYQEKDCRLVICVDISEKEKYLEKIRDKSKKLLTAQQIAKLGYWTYDLDTNKFYWSDEVFKIWGRKKENFNANLQNFRKTIHPDDLEKFDKENAKAVEGKKELDFEHRILLPDGSTKWVHERGKLIKKNGKTTFEGTVQDITEQKNSIEKLMQAEARQRAILKSQTNYLIRVDLEGNYTYCNDKFYRDFSWIFPDNKILGKKAKNSVHEYHHQRAQEVFDKCIENPYLVHQVEIDKLQEDGSAKPTLWDFVCLTNAEGEPVEIQCVGIDIAERVKMEEALKKSNKRHELVSKATSDAIYDWNVKTGNIFWSEAYNLLFGYESKTVPPDINAWAENVHSEDLGVIADLEAALAGNMETWQAEYRYRRGDGEYSHVSEKGFIVRDENEQAIRMVGAMQDITDRKSALQKLMKSEARHRGLIQSQTNYVIRVDMEGNYTYCNGKFKDDFGWIYPDGEVVGKDSTTSIKNYHLERVGETAQKCISSPDTVFQVEIDKPAKNGGVKTTLWDFVYLRTQDNDAGEIQCMGIDITDRVKVEEENRFQANLLNKIGQAIIATDVTGRITYWNKGASMIYGWSSEEALGENVLNIIPSDQSREQAEEIMIMLASGNMWTGEFVVQRKDGTKFPAYVTDAPFFDKEGNLKGIIGISSDISELKKAENELLKLNADLEQYTNELVAANKGLEQFSYIVSHNLRAPVANILGLGNLIENEEYPAEVKNKFQKEIISNVKRLDTIINDLNDILQIKVEVSEKKESINLNELVDTVKAGIDQVIKKEKVEILTDFSEVPEFPAVRTYLHSIFHNLIFNSIKYRHTDRSPVIKLEARRDGDKTLLIFIDNGIGMDLSRKKNELFGLYKRFHHHVEGKGMGLFMVKTQVELMGGKISAFSKENLGTRFVIEFQEKEEKKKSKNENATIHSS